MPAHCSDKDAGKRELSGGSLVSHLDLATNDVVDSILQRSQPSPDGLARSPSCPGKCRLPSLMPRARCVFSETRLPRLPGGEPLPRLRKGWMPQLCLLGLRRPVPLTPGRSCKEHARGLVALLSPLALRRGDVSPITKLKTTPSTYKSVFFPRNLPSSAKAANHLRRIVRIQCFRCQTVASTSYALG